ncbi:hypothetical protein BDC45DRAFT_564562 [Circinella umbellata]|nr:hypothetical protein BDC45DRAFT_564562 [Circinella umbellata]
MSLFDPEKATTFNEPQSTSARRSFELSNTVQQQHSYRPNTTTTKYQQQQQQQQSGRINSVQDRISSFYQRYRENNNNNNNNVYTTNNSGSSSSQSSTSYQKMSSLTSSSSSRSDIIELLFTRIVDALIFTSAIAITAYNYWMGALDNNNTTTTTTNIQPSLTNNGQHPSRFQHYKKPIMDIRQFRQTYAPKLNHTNDNDMMKQHDFLEDSKLQRTKRWAASQAKNQQETPSSPGLIQKSKLVQFPNNDDTQEIHINEDDKSDTSMNDDPTTQLLQQVVTTLPKQSSNNDKQNKKKRRTQSLPPPKRDSNAQAAQEKQDIMLTRMEERLQSLIEEGQAALTSKVELYELDEKEVAMRKAFAQRKKNSV